MRKGKQRGGSSKGRGWSCRGKQRATRWVWGSCCWNIWVWKEPGLNLDDFWRRRDSTNSIRDVVWLLWWHPKCNEDGDSAEQPGRHSMQKCNEIDHIWSKCCVSVTEFLYLEYQSMRRTPSFCMPHSLSSPGKQNNLNLITTHIFMLFPKLFFLQEKGGPSKVRVEVTDRSGRARSGLKLTLCTRAVPHSKRALQFPKPSISSPLSPAIHLSQF